jgi:ATP-dependent helicase/DNAse subunit B
MEKSRFLYQLKTKLKAFSNIEITDEIIASPPISIKPEMEIESSIRIKKTDDILTKLKQQTCSASSISMYLECELRFYFRYILELEETNSYTLDNMLQSAMIGTIIHAVLKEAVEDGHFKRMSKKEIEQSVRNYICYNKDIDLRLTEEDLLYEKNYLVFQIIVKYINSYLEYAQRFEKNVVIEKTEEEIKQTIEVDGTPISLKGYIDRVDLQEGKRHIIDYKTGKLNDKELEVDDMETIFDGEHSKAFQLLFYAYLYHKTYKETLLEAEIVSFRKISGSYILTIDKEKQLSGEILGEFEDILVQVIRSMLDVSTPFQATSVLSRCKYCLYKNICLK